MQKLRREMESYALERMECFGTGLQSTEDSDSVLCMAQHITEIIPNDRGSNFTVKCSCGTEIGVASIRREFAEDVAERHVRDAPFREAEQAAWEAEEAAEEDPFILFADPDFIREDRHERGLFR